jgi:two-component system invasion response regulator UvrY
MRRSEQPYIANTMNAVPKIVLKTRLSLVRHGVQSLLYERWKNAEITEVSYPADIIALQNQERWDMLILDCTVSRWRCLEFLDEGRRHAARLPVLIVNIHADDLFLRRILSAGAAGYLAADVTPQEFIQAVQTVRSGGRYISASLAEQTVFILQATATEPAHARLSNREHEIIHLLANGKTISEAAQTLSLSVKTASTYRARILKKLGLRTNAELILYAIQEGLTP